MYPRDPLTGNGRLDLTAGSRMRSCGTDTISRRVSIANTARMYTADTLAACGRPCFTYGPWVASCDTLTVYGCAS